MSNPDKRDLAPEQLESLRKEHMDLHEKYVNLQEKYTALKQELETFKNIEELRKFGEEFYTTMISNPQFAKLYDFSSKELPDPASSAAEPIKLELVLAMCLDALKQQRRLNDFECNT